MNSIPRLDIVRLQRLVVCQLLAGMNELDLIHLNAFLFLQGLLDCKDLVFRFKVESLLAASQGLDKDL